MSNQWKVICKVTDIPVLGSRVVNRADKPNVAIFRNSEDKVFALLDRCPHKGGPLSPVSYTHLTLPTSDLV